MSDDEAASRPEIKTDEEWKERVRSEARDLDQGRAETSGSAPGGDPVPDDEDLQFLPPASFAMLVQMFCTQAIVALGMVPEPHTGEPKLRPRLAKHFIDLLGVLETKTKGQLTAEEEELLSTNLHELRMAYVEQTRSAEAAKARR